MKVKLCGFTEEASLRTAIESKCDFVGFVFHEKSPRNISLQQASFLGKIVPSSIAKVAVTVDPNPEFLKQIAEHLQPDFFQFHGSESPDFIRYCQNTFPKVKIIKAIKISSAQDLTQVAQFENLADFFLFDSKSQKMAGGTGQKFNWEILCNLSCKKDWFLSGGLNVDNIFDAIKTTGAKMIDISSGIEESLGKKSPRLIKEFMEKVRIY